MKYQPQFNYDQPIEVGIIREVEENNADIYQSPLTPSTTPPPQEITPTDNHPVGRFIRITGNANQVDCVCLDRTGKFIFTVSSFTIKSKLDISF